MENLENKLEIEEVLSEKSKLSKREVWVEKIISHQRNAVIIISVLIMSIIMGSLILFVISGNTIESVDPPMEVSGNRIINSTATPAPIVTPFPFQELTIPYLRTRDYSSSLGELRQFSENTNYTSYVTNYDSDGFKVNGLLTIPKGTVPQSPEGDVGWPAIVFVHGYIPPQEYRTTVNYNSYVHYLARNDFVVFKIDLRGHDQSEGIPGGAYYSGDYIIDVLNARAALQNFDNVNPNKIGLWGHSMAGNVVFRSFVAKQNIPAVVIWAGAVYTYEDMREFGIQDNSYEPPDPNSERAKRRRELREAHGDFDPESEFWKQVVPTNYLDGIQGSVQISHAENDNVVSIGYSRNLISILNNTQIAHELNEYPAGGHNLTGSTFTQAMQEAVEFFNTHLR